MEEHPDKISAVVIGGYRVLGKPIGKGGFADVFLAEDRTGRQVALKKISVKNVETKISNYKDRIRKEVEIHAKLSKPAHPNVVRLFDYFQDDDFVYVVMEYCPHGDVRHFLKENGPLSEHMAARVLEQVVRGIKFLHDHDVIHRDVSTSNVLISKKTNNDLVVKIADLGLSTQQTAPNQRHFTMCGTPNFISPEVALKKGHGKSADIWSLGAFLYTLLSGRAPFGENREVSETIRRIIAGRREDSSQGTTFSDEANDLIKQMMNPREDRRITVNEILRHPFLTSRIRYLSRPHSSFASADSGWSSMRGSTFSGPSVHPSRSLDRNRNRRISPSPPTRGPFRVNRFGSGELPPSVPINRKITGDSAVCSRPGIYDETPIRTGVHLSHKSGSDSHSCLHSQFTEEERCRRCGRRLSGIEMGGRKRSPVAISRCASYRDTGSCKGTCKNRIRSPRELPCEREIDKSCGVEKENVSSPPAVRSPFVETVGCSTDSPNNVKLLKPISTERLKPHVEKTKRALVRILENGEVRLEFFKTSAGTEVVMEVMRIGSNGRKVGIYELGEGTVADKVVPACLENSKHHSYSLTDLPESYHKKYTFATKAVDLVRSVTPKVTLYTGNSKAILKENGDFELNFGKYERGKYEKSVVFKTKSGRKEIYARKVNTGGMEIVQGAKLSDDEVAYFNSKLGHCQSIEHALEALANDENPCFPVIIGRDSTGGSAAVRTPRTPNSETIIRETFDENTPQLPVEARKPLSQSRSNLLENERRNIRKYIPQHECTVEKGSDGSCTLNFHRTDETLRLGKDGFLNFRGSDGKELRYHMKNKDSLPSDVKRKVKILNDIGASSLF